MDDCRRISRRWCSPARRFRSARPPPLQWFRGRRPSRSSAKATPNIRLRRRATSAARAALTSNRRMRANSSKATSVRTAGVSCLSRRRRPSPGKAAGVSLGAALIAAGRGLRSARCITPPRAALAWVRPRPTKKYLRMNGLHGITGCCLPTMAARRHS